MAVLQLTKSSGADTCGEFLQKYLNIVSSPLFSSNSLQVHMVFNQYWATSWKEGVSKGEHSLASKCKSEVLPLQYQDNGESILQIQKKGMALIF